MSWWLTDGCRLVIMIFVPGAGLGVALDLLLFRFRRRSSTISTISTSSVSGKMEDKSKLSNVGCSSRQFGFLVVIWRLVDIGLRDFPGGENPVSSSLKSTGGLTAFAPTFATIWIEPPDTVAYRISSRVVTFKLPSEKSNDLFLDWTLVFPSCFCIGLVPALVFNLRCWSFFLASITCSLLANRGAVLAVVIPFVFWFFFAAMLRRKSCVTLKLPEPRSILRLPNIFLPFLRSFSKHNHDHAWRDCWRDELTSFVIGSNNSQPINLLVTL